MNISNKKLPAIEAYVSIVGNVLLFGLKLWAGIITGSIALRADAWHTLSDTFSSIVVLVGAKVSEKPADERHPFGHGRAELIASFLIGIMLALIAFSFIEKAIENLQGGAAVNYGRIAIVVTFISMVIKELMAQFALWAGRRVRSNSLKADAWHHRTDAISSLVILVGIFLGRFFWWIDGVLAILVAIMILYSTWEILRDTLDQLLGKKPNDQTIEAVKRICSHHGVKKISVHHFHIHEYGDHTEMTFHLRLPDDMSIAKAHDVVSKIEATIRDELDIESTIHIEPLTGQNVL